MRGPREPGPRRAAVPGPGGTGGHPTAVSGPACRQTPENVSVQVTFQVSTKHASFFEDVISNSPRVSILKRGRYRFTCVLSFAVKVSGTSASCVTLVISACFPLQEVLES